MAFNLRDFLRQLLERFRPPKPEPPPVPPPVPPPPASSYAAQLLAEHNRVRAVEGLPSYVNNAVLVRLAQEHSQFQADHDELTHYGPAGNTPWDRLRDAGYSFTSASENAAAGQTSAAQAVQGWLSSTVGHRENVLGAFTETGGGMAESKSGKKYWTQVYATPVTARALAEREVAEPIRTEHGWIL